MVILHCYCTLNRRHFYIFSYCFHWLVHQSNSLLFYLVWESLYNLMYQKVFCWTATKLQLNVSHCFHNSERIKDCYSDRSSGTQNRKYPHVNTHLWFVGTLLTTIGGGKMIKWFSVFSIFQYTPNNLIAMFLNRIIIIVLTIKVLYWLNKLMLWLWFGVMVKLSTFKCLFVNAYFSINSILGVQCHSVNKCFFCSTDKTVCSCIVTKSWVNLLKVGERALKSFIYIWIVDGFKT